MSLLFKPIGIITGLVAGILAKKIFELAWGLVDDEETAPRGDARPPPAEASGREQLPQLAGVAHRVVAVAVVHQQV